MAEYEAAHALQPDNPELAFWHGVALAANGREAEGRELLERAYADREGWRELLRRLPAAGLFPDDPALLDRMTAARLAGTPGRSQSSRGSGGVSPRL